MTITIMILHILVIMSIMITRILMIIMIIMITILPGRPPAADEPQGQAPDGAPPCRVILCYIIL